MTNTHRFTLLGTGSSGGVPRVGNEWGNCDPSSSRNRRKRCALLVERIDSADNRTTVLIDAGADLREQLLGAEVESIEAVLLTHSHADHIFGLDDLRQLAMLLKRSIDVYMDEATSQIVMRSFAYCFHQAQGSSYPKFCNEHRFEHPADLSLSGPGGELAVQSVIGEHGDIHALGFVFGSLAYVPDVKRIVDKTSLQRLEGLDVLILDALRYKRHPSHMSVEEALSFSELVKPRRTILTNMHSDLDYETLRASLPEGVEPGYDGMVVDLPGEHN